MQNRARPLTTSMPTNLWMIAIAIPKMAANRVARVAPRADGQTGRVKNPIIGAMMPSREVLAIAKPSPVSKARAKAETLLTENPQDANQAAASRFGASQAANPAAVNPAAADPVAVAHLGVVLLEAVHLGVAQAVVQNAPIKGHRPS